MTKKELTNKFIEHYLVEFRHDDIKLLDNGNWQVLNELGTPAWSQGQEFTHDGFRLNIKEYLDAEMEGFSVSKERIENFNQMIICLGLLIKIVKNEKDNKNEKVGHILAPLRNLDFSTEDLEYAMELINSWLQDDYDSILSGMDKGEELEIKAITTMRKKK